MLLRCPDIDVYKSVLKIHVDHTPFKYILFYAGISTSSVRGVLALKLYHIYIIHPAVNVSVDHLLFLINSIKMRN